MDTNERIKMIKAMEFLVRHLNAEDEMALWLSDGVADGDIKFGDLTVNSEDKELLEYHLEDENFAYLMNIFLHIMQEAYKDGGLYCDKIVSE